MNPTKIGGEPRCSLRISNACFACDTRKIAWRKSVLVYKKVALQLYSLRNCNQLILFFRKYFLCVFRSKVQQVQNIEQKVSITNDSYPQWWALNSRYPSVLNVEQPVSLSPGNWTTGIAQSWKLNNRYRSVLEIEQQVSLSPENWTNLLWNNLHHVRS